MHIPQIIQESPGLQDKPAKIWNSVFIGAFTINLLLHLCTNSMGPLVAKYADHLGATATIVGLVTSLFALTALIFKLVSAPAIDTFNRKYVLLGSMLIMFVAFVFYTVSKTIPMLMFSRLLQGTAQAFTTTCCLTIASDSLPFNRMSTGIGYFSLGMAICQAIAPAVGLKLVDIIGYNMTFAVFAIFILLAMAYAMTMKTNFKSGKKFKITLDSIIAKEALIPATLLFLLSLAFCVVNSFLVLFAAKQGVNSNIGYFFTVYAGTLLFTRPMIGSLADRYGTVKVIVPSLFFFAAAFLLISISTTLPMFLLAAFVSAFGYGGCQPSIQAVCMKSVPKERRGAASCTSYVGQDVGQLVGAVLAGAIIESFGYTNMWRIMIFPMAVAMIMAILFRNRITRMGEGFNK